MICTSNCQCVRVCAFVPFLRNYQAIAGGVEIFHGSNVLTESMHSFRAKYCESLKKRSTATPFNLFCCTGSLHLVLAALHSFRHPDKEIKRCDVQII